MDINEELKKILYARLHDFVNFFKSNLTYIVLCVIYLILAWALFFQFSILGLLLCLIFYAISLAITFSPAGEWIMRVIKHARPVETREEKEYILPIFEDVLESAQIANPDLKGINLYLIDSMDANACAIAPHCIGLTKGAIDLFSPDELKGVLAHEFGHISNGDTQGALLSVVGNGIFTLFIIAAKSIMGLIDTYYFRKDKEHKNGFAKFFVAFFCIIMQATLFLVMFVSNVFTAVKSRYQEYRADNYARYIGYRTELIDALYLIQKTSLTSNKNLLERAQTGHPRTSKRIMLLEQQENEHTIIT